VWPMGATRHYSVARRSISQSRCDVYDTARPSSPWYCVNQCRESVMAAKNAYLVQERLYPLLQLSSGIVFTFCCIGLLGYGMLALMGY